MAEPTLASLQATIDVLNATLSAQITQITETESKSQEELNTFYLMWAGALIFLMQAGFATLSAGSIRARNVKNILLKNLLDACIGALAWYFLGYGFAYDADDNPNPFIGVGASHFALSGYKDWDGAENKGCAPLASAAARLIPHASRLTCMRLESRGRRLDHVVLPVRLLRGGGHYRLGCRGRALPALGIPRLLVLHLGLRLPGRGALGVGWRGLPLRLQQRPHHVRCDRLCRLRCGAYDRRLRGAGASYLPSSRPTARPSTLRHLFQTPHR